MTNNQRVTKRLFSASGIQHDWFVSLTQKGGEKWENIFEPDWKSYMSMNEYITDNDIWELRIEAGSNEALGALLKRSFSGNKFYAKPEVVKLTPWNPVYWKKGLNGFVTSLKVSEELVSKLEHEYMKIRWRRSWGLIDGKYLRVIDFN